MKKNIFLSLAFITALLVACGPAAEDREQMHARAKIFQDSIANFLRTSMAEAETPANTAVMVDTAAARRNAEAAATATAK